MNTDDLEKNSQNISSILEGAAVKAFSAERGQIDQIFDLARDECLSFNLTDEEKHEVERRTLEWKFRIHCEGDSDYNDVTKLHSELIDIGYTNFEVESNMEIYFAQYCSRTNRESLAKEIISKLKKKIEVERLQSDSEFYAEIEKFCEGFINNIEGLN